MIPWHSSEIAQKSCYRFNNGHFAHHIKFSRYNLIIEQHIIQMPEVNISSKRSEISEAKLKIIHQVWKFIDRHVNPLKGIRCCAIRRPYFCPKDFPTHIIRRFKLKHQKVLTNIRCIPSSACFVVKHQVHIGLWEIPIQGNGQRSQCIAPAGGIHFDEVVGFTKSVQAVQCRCPNGWSIDRERFCPSCRACLPTLKSFKPRKCTIRKRHGGCRKVIEKRQRQRTASVVRSRDV